MSTSFSPSHHAPRLVQLVCANYSAEHLKCLSECVDLRSDFNRLIIYYDYCEHSTKRHWMGCYLLSYIFRLRKSWRKKKSPLSLLASTTRLKSLQLLSSTTTTYLVRVQRYPVTAVKEDLERTTAGNENLRYVVETKPKKKSKKVNVKEGHQCKGTSEQQKLLYWVVLYNNNMHISLSKTYVSLSITVSESAVVVVDDFPALSRLSR